MNTQEHLVVVCSEEAGEVAEAALGLPCPQSQEIAMTALHLQKACCKLMRFGGSDINPERGLNAIEVFVAEFNDLIGSVELLQESGVELPGLYDRGMIDAKKDRVRHYMEYAMYRGSISV
jgi:hypothetical protein